MIDGNHVRKQVSEAVREVVRRFRFEQHARDYVASVHEAIDEEVGKVSAKMASRWAEAKAGGGKSEAPKAAEGKPKTKRRGGDG